MNWKYILIIVILAAIVGGGILIYQYWWVGKPPVKVSPGPTDETLDETFCNKDDDCVIIQVIHMIVVELLVVA